MYPFLLHSGLAGLWKLLKERIFFIAFIIYFFISAFILYRYGINTGGEATKYMEDANRILSGGSLRYSFFSSFYVIYSLLISFFIYFSFSFYWIGLLQVLISFIAACCIYKILLHVTGDKRVSFITFICYLLCLPVQKWNFFLYTESLHTGFVTIGLFFFYCVFIKQQTKRWWMFFCVLLLIIFTRPVGIIFFLSAFIVWMLILTKERRKLIYYPAIILFISLCVMLLQSKFAFYFNPDSLRRMEIICQVPQTDTTAVYKEYNASGIGAFFHVIFSEIGVKSFLINGIKKIVSFLGMVRSFYSTTHNMVLLITAVLLYPFAILGLFFFRNVRSLYIKSFSFIYVFVTSVGIFFTCDEWSNRFVAPVLPFIIILAGTGLHYTYNKFSIFKK